MVTYSWRLFIKDYIQHSDANTADKNNLNNTVYPPQFTDFRNVDELFSPSFPTFIVSVLLCNWKRAHTNTGARTDTSPLFTHLFELADVHTLERTDDSVTMDNEESQSFGYRRSTQFMDTFSQLVWLPIRDNYTQCPGDQPLDIKVNWRVLIEFSIFDES